VTLAAPQMFSGALPLAALAPPATSGVQDSATVSGAACAPGGFLAELLAWSSVLASFAASGKLQAPEETSEAAEVSIASHARSAFGPTPPAGEPQHVPDAAGLPLASLWAPAVVAAPAMPHSYEAPGSGPVPVDPAASVLPIGGPVRAAGTGESVAPLLSRPRPDRATAAPAGLPASGLSAAQTSPKQAPDPATQPAEAALSARPLPLPAAPAPPRNEAACGEPALAMALTQKAPAHPLEASRAPQASPPPEAPGWKTASAAGPMAAVPPEASVPEAAAPGAPTARENGLTSATAARQTARTARPARQPEAAKAADGLILSGRSPGASAEPQAEPGRPVPATEVAAGPAESPAHSVQDGVRPEPQPSGRLLTFSGAAPASSSESGRALPEDGAPRLASQAPVRRIELRLARKAAEAVTVEVAERRGRIELAVRTPDPDLAASLGEQAAEIARRLEAAGFRAQAWTPHAPARPGEARLEIAPQPAPDFDNRSGDGRQHGGGGHPDERDRREPHPEFPLEEFPNPAPGGKEIDS
jgi:hypothetical protein